MMELTRYDIAIVAGLGRAPVLALRTVGNATTPAHRGRRAAKADLHPLSAGNKCFRPRSRLRYPCSRWRSPTSPTLAVMAIERYETWVRSQHGRLAELCPREHAGAR
jgi:hypothetical protein